MTSAATTRRLAKSIRLLIDRFRHELSGPRQATRRQMVHFLARELEIAPEAASELFEDLRKAGVIVRGDEPLTESLIPGRDGQRWAIHSEVAESDLEVHESKLASVKPPVESEPHALDLVRRAIANRASDIHLDPFHDETEVRFRIDGRLEHYCRLSEEIGARLMSQLKVLADLDPTEPFHSQEGRLKLPVSLSEYDVRITATPLVSGDAVALRLLRRDQIVRPIEELGFSESAFAKIKEMLKRDEGMVLVGGPAGAGKTTTLYSLTKAMDNGHRNIVTIEDPVEYLVPEFLQLQVDVRHEMSMAKEVRTVLRMDPDVILLGEIRDRGTAEAALLAASSGRYVFCTFHARDSAAAIGRLNDLGIDDASLASNVRASISQRLVRRLCQKCRGKRGVSTHEAEIFQSEGLKAPSMLATPTGCEHCRQTGYSDRIGVFEVAVITTEIASAIEAGAKERELRQLFRNEGTHSLMADGLEKVAEGITSFEEVCGMTWLHVT